jgi:ubiquinone/menaquinone biosynthesis C-methylase UbiE
MIKLEHFGISPFEIEVIYNTLSKFSLVDEGKILVEEYEYVSLLNIEFPVAYDEYFFQSFGFDNWQKIKYVLKEMKRRRGRKRFKITLSFCGISTDINSKLVFSLTSEIGPQFEYAIEKIEHIIDTIHVEIKNLESKRQSMSYTYDAIAMKWVLVDLI